MAQKGAKTARNRIFRGVVQIFSLCKGAEMSAAENQPMPLLPMCDDGRKSDEIDAAIFGFLNCCICDMEALTEWVLVNAAEA